MKVSAIGIELLSRLRSLYEKQSLSKDSKPEEAIRNLRTLWASVESEAAAVTQQLAELKAELIHGTQDEVHQEVHRIHTLKIYMQAYMHALPANQVKRASLRIRRMWPEVQCRSFDLNKCAAWGRL